jgi:hypothetical protein
MNEIVVTFKHFAYSLATFFVLSFGMLLLNQAQELNDAAKVLAAAILSFGGYLSYELLTTKDYKLMPFWCFGVSIIVLIGVMCLYS